MCLEVKKQKAKNDWFTCTLKSSKRCTRKIIIRNWNKKKEGSTNVFRGFEAPKKVYGWWIFKLNYIHEGLGDSFCGYKPRYGCCI